MDLVKRLILLVLLLAGSATAQFVGYTAAQSQFQVVFTNQAANAVSSTFQNVGQSAHFLTYCLTNFAGTIRLEASADGTFAPSIQIANATWGTNGQGNDSNCHVLQAGGYYPAVHARVANYLAGSVTAWYTAVGSPVAFMPPAFNSNGPTAPIVCDNTQTGIAVAPNTGPTQMIAAGQPIFVCGGVFSLSSGTPTDGSIGIGVGGSGTCVGNLIIYSIKIEANTPQIFPLGMTLKVPQGSVLCITAGNNTVTVNLTLSFAQGPFSL